MSFFGSLRNSFADSFTDSSNTLASTTTTATSGTMINATHTHGSLTTVPGNLRDWQAIGGILVNTKTGEQIPMSSLSSLTSLEAMTKEESRELDDLIKNRENEIKSKAVEQFKNLPKHLIDSIYERLSIRKAEMEIYNVDNMVPVSDRQEELKRKQDITHAARYNTLYGGLSTGTGSSTWGHNPYYDNSNSQLMPQHIEVPDRLDKLIDKYKEYISEKEMIDIYADCCIERELKE